MLQYSRMDGWASLNEISNLQDYTSPEIDLDFDIRPGIVKGGRNPSNFLSCTGLGNRETPRNISDRGTLSRGPFLLSMDSLRNAASSSPTSSVDWTVTNSVK